MTKFKATYSNDFKQKPLVETIITQWNTGVDTFILKTSGSTGTPKDIKLSKKLLLWSAERTKATLQLTDKEQILCCLPVAKTGGFMQLIRALHFGWHIHFVNPSTRPFSDTVDDILFVDHTSMTPYQIRAVIYEDFDEMQGLLNILVGGGPIDNELENILVNFSRATCCNIWETYGMTETASHIALRKIGRDNYLRPIEGVQLSLEEDCLCVAIPELGFKINTSDIALLHEDGFEILGRADDVINSGGIKIHPKTLEPQIQEVLLNSGIDRSFFLGKKHSDKLGDEAVLVIEGTSLDDTDYLLQKLKSTLPKHHNPRSIEFINKFKYTDTGKLIRNRS